MNIDWTKDDNGVRSYPAFALIEDIKQQVVETVETCHLPRGEATLQVLRSVSDLPMDVRREIMWCFR